MTKKKLLIAGGTGLIGTRLIQLIDAEKYDIHILTRKKKAPHDNIKYFRWNLKEMTIDEGAVDVDYIINFTGAGIADKRWTDRRKKELIESRTNACSLIAKEISSNNYKIKAMVGASAIGFYGNRGDEKLTEFSGPGLGFLAECCKKWENATNHCLDLVERGVVCRIGIVLTTRGGALQKILMTEGVRLLNYFGNGNQYYSWIHIDDLCTIIMQALEKENYSGVYNAVSPEPLTNKTFMHKVAEGLIGRFFVIPAPAIGLKLALGEMAAVVLDSTRVYPQRLLENDFKYKFSSLPQAIQDLKSRSI